MKRYPWLFLIVLLAGVLRFWNLTQVPPALNSDEVAIGYNAYSILKTGKDEYNVAHPLTFRSFDDYKMPVDVYLIAGSMYLFGYGDFAVRFPSALFGTLTVLLMYFLTRELFKGLDNKQEAISNGQEAINNKQSNRLLLTDYCLLLTVYCPLLSSFLLAISPWSLMFSRSGYGSNIAVFFAVLAVYLFLKGCRRGIWLPISAIAFSLSIWSYHSSRIFVPLMLFGLAFLYHRLLMKKKLAVAVSMIIGFLLLFPLLKMTFSVEGNLRAVGVSAFGNPDELTQSVNWIIQDTSRGLSVFNVFHNRRFIYLQTFLRGYFTHFDANYLFLDKSIEKYRAPGVGLLYLFELPFLFVGCYGLIRKRLPGSIVVFWWLLTAPVAAAFTLQLPHPGRTLIMLPALEIIVAVGLAQAISWISNTTRTRVWKIFSFAALTIVIAGSLMYFLDQYFVHLPIDDASYWYVGRREMTQKIERLKSNYDTIYVSNSLDFPYIFYLYYAPIDPASYQKQGGTVSGGFEEQRNHVGNVSFRSINTSLRDPLKKILFVGLPGEVFKKSLVIDTVNYPDGTPAIVFFR